MKIDVYWEALFVWELHQRSPFKMVPFIPQQWTTMFQHWTLASSTYTYNFKHVQCVIVYKWYYNDNTMIICNMYIIKNYVYVLRTYSKS